LVGTSPCYETGEVTFGQMSEGTDTVVRTQKDVRGPVRAIAVASVGYRSRLRRSSERCEPRLVPDI